MFRKEQATYSSVVELQVDIYIQRYDHFAGEYNLGGESIQLREENSRKKEKKRKIWRKETGKSGE